MAILLRRGKGMFGGEAIFDRRDGYARRGGERRGPRLHQFHRSHHHPAAMDVQDRAGVGANRLGAEKMDGDVGAAVDRRDDNLLGRSEEHTSELPSLMRISY